MIHDRNLMVDDIPGAKPKIRHPAAMKAMMLDSELDQPMAVFLNRNKLNNGDIIGLSNQNPMVENLKLKTGGKRQV